MARPTILILLLFVTLGLGLGLYIGWVVSPVKYVDTDPASLDQVYKDDYILMIATLYSENGDLEAARARLEKLGFPDPGLAVAEAAQRLITDQKPEQDLRRIVALAAAFNAATPEMQPYLPPTPNAP